MTDDIQDTDTSQGSLALPDQLRPQRIYLIPVRHRPFMPGLVQPVMLDKQIWEQTEEKENFDRFLASKNQYFMQRMSEYVNLRKII